MSDDEDDLCPLCVEGMDLSDKFFKPCPCGYRICRFCWHYIKENGNGLCPACRRAYTDEDVQFRPVTAEEMVKLKAENNAKKRAKKEEKISKKHLANTRVVQKNLVYVSGLNPKITTEEALRSNEYFGQFGKILRIVFQKKQQGQALAPLHQSNVNSGGVFVTFASKADAGKAIVGLHGTVVDGRMLRANYGTTKYCQTYLRNQTCTNAACMYLHEPGEDTDSFSKDELVAARQQLKDQDAHRNRLLPKQAPNQNTHRSEAPLARPNVGKPANWETLEHHDDSEEGSALPPTASWATKPVTQASRSGPPSAPASVARKLPEETARPTTAEKIDSWEAIEDEAESRASDIVEGTVPAVYPDLAKAESIEESSEQPAPSEQTRSLGAIGRQLVAPQPPLHTPRPALSTTEALGIALPFPYSSVAEEPSTVDDHFAHDNYYMPPNSRLDRFGMDLNFLKPPLYRGTFDPFGDNRPASIPPAAPSRGHGLLSPEFPGFGVGLPRQPPYNQAAVQPQTEYHGTFDPFREDISPVAPNPPGMGSMADNPARPARPPGLFESGRPAGSHFVTDVITDAHQTSSDDTQAAGPRRASRFGFAQDPEPRPDSAGAGPLPMRMQTQQQNFASEPAVPADNQDIFKRLLSANNGSFEGGAESHTKPTIFREETWSVPSSRLQELSTTPVMPSLRAAGGVQRYDTIHALPTLVNAGVRDSIAEHSWQEFRSGTPDASLPMTSSAQDFLGAFLKAARQHPQPVENKADQSRNGSYAGDARNASVDDGSEPRKQPAFQDPAIMVIGRRSSSNTTPAAQTPSAPSFPANRDSSTLARYRLPVMQHVTQGAPAEHNVVGSSREARQTPTSAGSAPAKQQQDPSAKGTNGPEKGGRKKGDTAGEDPKVAKVNQESKGGSQQHPLRSQQQQKQQQPAQKAQAQPQPQPLQVPASARKNRKGRIAEKEAVSACVANQPASSRLLSGPAASHDTKTPGEEPAVAARNTAADGKWSSRLPSTVGKGESEPQTPSPSDAGSSLNQEQARKVALRGSVSSHGSSASQPSQQSSGSKKQRNRQQQQAKQNGVDMTSRDEPLAETSTGNVKENEPAPGYEKATKPDAGNTSFPAATNKHQQAATGNRKGGKQMTSKAESAFAFSATSAAPPSAPSGNAEKDTPALLPQASSAAVVDNSSGSIQSTVRDIPGVFPASNLPNPVDFLSRDFCLSSAKFGISGDGADVIANALSRLSSTAEAGDPGKTTAGGSPFAGAADDVATLERKVIEARREAALLENQLNAVIKKNRRYTGKI